MIGFGDSGDVPVRIYWPPGADDGNAPVVVFYHGGGWAIGDLDVYDSVARRDRRFVGGTALGR